MVTQGDQRVDPMEPKWDQMGPKWIHGPRDQFVTASNIAVREARRGRIRRGFVIHHINERRADNRISNLSIMTRAEHNRLHALLRRLYFEKQLTQQIYGLFAMCYLPFAIYSLWAIGNGLWAMGYLLCAMCHWLWAICNGLFAMGDGPLAIGYGL